MRTIRGALLLAFASAAGCGAESSLDGSIGSTLSLDYDAVRIVVQPDAVRVEYIQERGEYVLKVCKLAVERRILQPGFNTVADERFRQHVSVSRAVRANEDFPAVRTGILELDDLDPGFAREISGGFAVEFVDGNTLDGTFAAEPIVLDLAGN